MASGRELGFLAAWSAGATATALALSALVAGRLHDRAEAALGRAFGEKVHIGDAEVELDGTLRLRDVSIGQAVHVDAIEAGVGATALFAGRFAADEVRVRGPHLLAHVDDHGRIDLAALVDRAQRARHSGAAPGVPTARRFRGAPRLGRIVVTGGELVVEVAGTGTVRAAGVELHPQAGGVRLIATRVAFDLHRHDWRLAAEFGRVGADVELPRVAVTRAALAGGHLHLRHADAPALELQDGVLVRESGDKTRTRFDARVVGSGELGVELVRTEAAAGAPTWTVNVAARELPLGPLGPALPAGLGGEHARVGGTVKGRIGGDRFELDGIVTGQALELRHAVLAKEPVALDLTTSFRADFDRGLGEGHLEWDAQSAGLRVRGEAELGLDGKGQLRSGRIFVDVPELACADAFAAIPAALRRPLAGLTLGGTIAAHLEVAVDLAEAAPAPASLDVHVAERCSVLDDAPAARVATIAGAYAHTLADGRVRTFAPADPDFVALRDLPRHVPLAFVAGEDARFFAHDGFDLEQLERSLAVDVAARRVERGGSTISQQLAKNLFLSRERTLTRKLLEAVLTWRLEATLPKPRLLEIYLNIIELGDGVYGIGPAAKRWFGKPAAELTLVEAAFLAALTPAPLSSERRIRAALALDVETTGRVRAILRSMRRNRLISDGQLAAALGAIGHLELELGAPTP
jgi:hypothetical protein